MWTRGSTRCGRSASTKALVVRDSPMSKTLTETIRSRSQSLGRRSSVPTATRVGFLKVVRWGPTMNREGNRLRAPRSSTICTNNRVCRRYVQTSTLGRRVSLVSKLTQAQVGCSLTTQLLRTTTAVNARNATALRRAVAAFLPIGNFPFTFTLLAASGIYSRPLGLEMCSGNMADSAAVGTMGTIEHIRMTTQALFASHWSCLAQRTWAACPENHPVGRRRKRGRWGVRDDHAR